MTSRLLEIQQPLPTRLRFHGRHASETQDMCTARKNVERVEAAARIEALEAAIDEAHNFLTSPAKVTPAQRIANAAAELEDVRYANPKPEGEG